MKKIPNKILIPSGLILTILILPFVIREIDYCVNYFANLFLSNTSDNTNSYPSIESLSEVNPYKEIKATGNYTKDLQRIIMENNCQCPIRIGDGMAVAMIKEESGFVTHYCIVNESEWNLAGMSEDAPTKESMKLAMKDYMITSCKNDNKSRNSILLYLKNKKGLKYHYYGTVTDSSFDIIYSCSELENIIKLTN